MLIATLLVAAATAAPPRTPPPETPPGSAEFRHETDKVVDLDAWPAAAARAAEEGMAALGPPHYFDEEKLLWNEVDGARRTEVRREAPLPVLQVVPARSAPESEEAPGVRWDRDRREADYEGKSLEEVRGKRGLKPARP